MTSEHFRHPAPGVDAAPAPRGRPNEGPPIGPCSLRVEDASGDVTWHALELDAYDVGREVERGIRLASREVSRLHARLERDAAGRWWVAPVAERARTLVNGKPARDRRRLAPWDDVQLGPFHLRLVPRGASGDGPDRLRELLLPFVEDDMVGRPPPARVRLYEGPLGGHDVRLDRGVVVFGAGPDATVPLEGRRHGGVCVEFRAVRGGFEVVDRSERPGMTVNGHELRRFELSSDELVGIGDVERQRKDSRDALRVRFLPGERRVGLDTTPAPDASGREAVASSPAPDATARTLGAPGEASGADTDPGGGPPTPADVAPRGAHDTAVDLVAPHEAPASSGPATDPAPGPPSPPGVAPAPGAMGFFDEAARRALVPSAAPARPDAVPAPALASAAVGRPPARSPERSPDGQDVAFSDRRLETTSPGWSPDGRDVAFSDRRPETTSPGRWATGPDARPVRRPWTRPGAVLGVGAACAALAAWLLGPRPTPPGLGAAPGPATSVTATEPGRSAVPSAPRPSASEPSAAAPPSSPPSQASGTPARSGTSRPPLAATPTRPPRVTPPATSEPSARPPSEDDGGEGKAGFCRALAARLAAGGALADVQRMFDQRCR